MSYFVKRQKWLQNEGHKSNFKQELERPEAVFPCSIKSVPPTGGRIICSPEQSKLCFEALEMNSVPQNNLPLQGLKTPSEVGVF